MTAPGGYRLSARQSELLALHGRVTEFPIGCRGVFLVEGPVAPAAAQAAWGAVVSRHDTLRLVVCSVEGEFRQAAHTQATRWDPWPEEEGRLITPDEWLDRSETAGWDLAEPPLLRSCLRRLEDGRIAIGVSFPAICCDSRGFEMLARELAQELAVVPVEQPLLQIGEVAEWQFELARLPEAVAGRRHWWPTTTAKAEFALPFERRVEARTNARLAECRIKAPPAAAVDLWETRGVGGVDGLLLACWAWILGRYSGETAPAIGVQCDGRRQKPLQRIPGALARQVPVAVQIVAGLPVRDAAGRMAAALNEAERWQDFFDNELQRRWTPSFPGGFPYRFSFLPSAAPVVIGEVGVSVMGWRESDPGTRIGLRTLRSGSGLRICLEYESANLDPGDIEFMGRGLELLFDGALEHPDRSLDDLAERWCAISHLERSTSVAATLDLVPARISRAAASAPGALAVRAEGAALTCADLEARTNRLARGLRARGAGPEVRIGLCLGRGVDLVVGLVAILKSGAAYVPLDPRLPSERLNEILETGVRMVLASKSTKSELQPTCADWLAIEELEAELEQTSADPVDAGLHPQNLAYVIHTSGSTGRAKGVAIEHGSLAHYVDAVTERLELVGQRAFANVSSLAADLGHTVIFPALATGACLHLIERDRCTDAEGLATYFDGEGIDCLKIVPTHLEALLGAVEDRRLIPRGRLVLGGEAFRPALAARLRALAPGTRLYNHYGPTETTVGTFACEVREIPEDPRLASVPIGHPLPGTWARILDRHLRPVPPWVGGELYLGGPQVARGYVGEPERTAERFVPDPFAEAPGARLYRTGDWVRIVPGRGVEWLGRLDDQVKLHGNRLELEALRVHLNRFPGVEDSLAIIRDGPNGDAGLRVYYVGASPLDAGALREWLATRFPEEVVPGVFVHLRAFPLTANGKIDRKRLAAAGEVLGGHSSGFRPPGTPTEKALAQLWSDLLGVDQVGVDDHFFHLGGHSLLAIRLMARVRERWGVGLPLRSIFDAPRLQALAAKVDESAAAAELSPIGLEPTTTEERSRLSHAQERLWFFEQFSPGSAVYNVPSGFRFRGALELGDLYGALACVLKGHGILRSHVEAARGVARLVIGREPRADIALERLDFLSEPERSIELRRRLETIALEPFDLEIGPLVRLVVLCLGSDDHAVVLNVHHLVSDAWSRALLVRELAAYLRSIRAGEAPRVPELPFQYWDYAAWQRRWLEGPGRARQMDYWRRRLAGMRPLALRTDRPRPPVQTFGGATRSCALPAETTRGADRFAREADATPFMVLLAAFQALLALRTRQSDFGVGIPVADRGHAAFESLIGFFVNTVVIRSDLSGDPTFRELTARVRMAALEAFDHQDLPFEIVVDELQPARDPSRHPLFQVMFVVENVAVGGVEVPGLAVEPLEIPNRISKFDLTLTLLRSEHALHAAAEFNTDLFEVGTIDTLLTDFAALLGRALQDPDRKVSDLLPAASTSPAPARRVAPGQLSALERFERRAEICPNAVATSAAGRQFTYADLDRWADSLAHELKRLALACEARVGLLLERGPEMVVGQLAAWKAGAAFVPLDPANPDDRLSLMTADCRPAAIVSTRRLHERAEVLATPVVWIEDVPASGARVCRPEGTPDPAGLAYVIYTSGSTGRPKGVAIPHGGLANLVDWHLRAFAITEADRASPVARPAFDASIWEVWPYLAAGAEVCFVDDDTALDPEGLAAWLVRAEITVTFLPTPLAERLLALEWPAATRLRLLLTGGDRLRAFPRPSMPFRLCNNYGPTETSVVATSGEVPSANDAGGQLPSIGGSIDGAQVYVVSSDGVPTPEGIPGEICIGGAGVARGYWDDPALTAERFVPDPFSTLPGARLFRSGDLGLVLMDGQLAFLERIDRQVKINGVRIETGEIEAALVRHAAVREAAVVALPRPGAEAGNLYLVAYFAALADHRTTAVELRAFLRERLPASMIPAVFVEIEALPWTMNGKLDRAALPIPSPIGAARHPAAEQNPLGDVQAALAGIWKDVLGLAQVGIHDNFFELGGDSILGIQVVSRARQVGLPLRASHVFKCQTIAEQSAVMGEIVEPTNDSVTPGDEVPLTPIQRWFFAREHRELHHWNQSLLLEIPRPVDTIALEAAVDAVFRRHDALHYRFRRVDGSWVQTHGVAGGPVPFSRVMCLDSGAGEQTSAIEREADLWQARLDLGDGPLFRVVHLECPGSQHDRLLLIAHHLVVDAVSWRILVEDLFLAHTQARAGSTISLPPKTSGFHEWARWLERDRPASLLEDARTWMKRQAWGATTAFPVDSVGDNCFGGEARLSVGLDPERSAALLGPVHLAYHTQVQDLLLAALVRTLGSFAGLTHVAIDVEFHGRTPLAEDLDLTRTVGWFTSLCPILFTVPSDCSPGVLLQTVKEERRAVPAHGIGYGLWVNTGEGRLESLPAPPAIGFNYLGHTGASGASGSAWRIAPESSGHPHHPSQLRPHLLDVSVISIPTGVQVTWSFHRERHREETVKLLARRYVEELARLVDHCLEPGAGGCTCSDFPEADLEADELEMVLDRVARVTPGREKGAVRWILPLTAAQTGMFLECMSASGRSIHVEQSVHELEGGLDIEAFAAAWQDVARRHPILLSLFLWTRRNRAVQVSITGASIPCLAEDVRALPPSRRAEVVTEHARAALADGFDLSAEMPLRLAVFRTEDHRFQVVCTLHHIVADGWSIPILLGDLLVAYNERRQGRPPAWEQAPTFETYVRWLQRRDLRAAELFWRRLWTGRGSAARVAKGAESGERRILEFELGEGPSRAWQDAAKAARTTPGVLLQAFWTLALAKWTGQLDHVFALTVSGRPPELPGADGMVGLFIHTVPLPVRVPVDADLHRWLSEIHELNAEVASRAGCSAGQIRAWAGADAAVPIDSVVVFENYPTVSFGAEPTEVKSPIRSVASLGARTNHPLALLCIPGLKYRFKLIHDPGRVDAGFIESIPQWMESWANLLVTGCELSVRTLLDRATPSALTPSVQVEPAEAPRVLPRDEMEFRIARIWEDLLGTSPIGVTNDFFALGGHSLMALELVERLGRQFDGEVSLGTLLRAPTIEALASHLRQRVEQRESPLVCLQPLGQMAPLFCVHPLGGHVLCYVDLARRLGTNRPVYGIEASGLYGSSRPQDRVESMAQHYLAAIRAVQPVGSLHLLGWSFGSFVAFEMARQLRDRGEEAAFLGVIDTPARPKEPKLEETSGRANSGNTWQGADWAWLSESVDVDALVKQACEEGRLPPGFSEVRARRILDVYRSDYRAFKGYQPQPFPGYLHLFPTTERLLEERGDPTLGWRTQALGGVSVHPQPGNHQSMLQEPHVTALAGGLRVALTREETRSAGRARAGLPDH